MPQEIAPIRSYTSMVADQQQPQLQRPSSRTYERSSPPRSSSRTENRPYESPVRQPQQQPLVYSRAGSGEQPIGTTLGDQYPTERSPERRAGSPTKTRILSRQPSVQKLSQGDDEIASFRRGNETGAALMEPQQQSIYDRPTPRSYGNEAAPMETSEYGGAGTGEGYPYDANSTFSNYDLDPSQNYSTGAADGHGMQYSTGREMDQQHQQPLYDPGDQYGGTGAEEYYQPQLPSNAYLDNGGNGRQSAQYQQPAPVGEYKYQPEPEYEYTPYQQPRQQQPAPAPTPSAPLVAAQQQQQQPKQSYKVESVAPPAVVSAPTTQQRATVRPSQGGSGSGGGSGTSKPTRVVPQSRASAAASSASVADRK